MNTAIPFLRILGLGVLAILALAGCSRPEGGPSGKAHVVVRMWAFPMLPELRDQVLYRDLVAEFRREQPGIDVQVEMLPWGGRTQKMITAIAGNRAPDAVYLNLDFMPRFVRMGVLRPVDDLMTPQEAADYDPAIRDAITLDGHVWLFPMLRNVNTGVYNKKLFRSSGLDPEKPPRTWEELAAAARAMTRDTDGDGRVDQWGVGFAFGGDTVNSTFWPLLWQAGGEVLSPDGRRAAFNSAAGVEALEFAAGLYRAGCVPPSFLNVGGNEFAQGRLGFFFGAGPNEAMQLKRDVPGLEIGVSPALEHKKRASYATIGSYAVFAASRHPRETALWLRFLIRPEIMRRFCRATNYIPARKSALPLYADDPILGVFEREVANCRPDVKSSHARQVMMRLTPELQSAALGRRTPREALDAAAADVNAMLEREP